MQFVGDTTLILFNESQTLEGALSDNFDTPAVETEHHRPRWNSFLKRKEDNPSTKIVLVRCGSSCSVAVSEKGQVFYWGTSNLVASTISTPVLVDGLSSLCCGIVRICIF